MTLAGEAGWLPQLRAMLDRHGDEDVAEEVSLGAQELLGGVPDYEICEALRYLKDQDGDPLAELLSAECGRRNLEY